MIRKFVGIGCFLAVWAILLAPGTAIYATGKLSHKYAPGHLILALTSGSGASTASGAKMTGLAQVDKLSSKLKITRADKLSRAIARKKITRRSSQLDNVYIIALPPDVDPAVAAREYATLPDVRYAEPDYSFRISRTDPNDTYFSTSGSWEAGIRDQWNLEKISCADAWDLQTGNSSLVMAVVDTGTDFTHPDIQANIWHNAEEIPGNGIDDDGNGYVDDYCGYDFCNSDGDPIDDSGHGTHVAGIIGAASNNAAGIAGVVWNCRIISIKALDSAGVGYASALANGIRYAVDQGARVINLSFGGPDYSQVLHDALVYAHDRDVIICAAAGNDSNDIAGYYPASDNNVITVSASDINDQACSFTNYGAKMAAAAPGGGLQSGTSCSPEQAILSLRAKSWTDSSCILTVGSDYLRFGGTSMAAPHVTGLSGLVVAQHPTWANEQVRQAIQMNSDDILAPGFDQYSGFGRINAYRALISTSPLIAFISAPYNGSTVTGMVPINGSATGPGFVEWTLDYGAGYEPTSWTPISMRNNPVLNGRLLDWDTSSIADGAYTLRLRTNGSGESLNAEYRMQVLVKSIVVSTQPLSDTSNTFGPYQVIANVAGITGAAVTMYWSRNGSDFAAVPMEQTAETGIYMADIPGPSNPGDRYCYYIVVNDILGEGITHRCPESGEYCFNILTPVIGVAPNSLSFTLAPGECGSADLTITNSGAGDLHYSVTERSGVASYNEPPADIYAKALDPINWAADHLPGRLIVGMKPGLSEAARAQVHSLFRTAVIKRYDLIPADLVEVPAGQDLRQIADKYAAMPEVAYAEPDYIRTIDRTPDDPQFGQLWGLNNIGQAGGTSGADISALKAWDITTGDRSVVAAVIDTGIDYNHPDLAANIWINPGEIPGNGIDDDGNGYVDDVHGYDFKNNDADPMDDNRHGTHVAGIIGAAGNNSLGVTGVNWNVRLMPLKFIGADGRGSDSDAISCIEYAVKMKADISNNSWGGTDYSEALRNAISAARDAGQLFITAAGNDAVDNDTNPHYPANYLLDNIISVSAVDSSDNLASFSCWGASSVHLAAPGAGIYSTVPNGGYSALNGTSMAAPYVAGTCALCLSISPHAPPTLVKSWIMSGVDAVPTLAGKTISGGRLNAWKSLKLAGINWLDESPRFGDIPAGGSAVVSVTADAAGFEDGFSGQGQIEITCNSGLCPPVAISVTLAVDDYIHINHVPLAATEDTTGPYIVNADISARAGLDDQLLALYWNTTGSGAFNRVPLQHVSGDHYQAQIPGQPASTTIYYYLSAGDNSGHQRTDPRTATSSCYSFRVIADNIPPAIVHQPMQDTEDLAGPYMVSAVVTDEIGIAAANLYWSRNGGGVTAVEMTPTGKPNEYAADIPGPSTLGDEYCYYIEARDASRAGNVARSPVGAPGEPYLFGIKSCIVDNLGTLTSSKSVTNGCAANVFSCNSSRLLTRIEQCLNISKTIDLRFFVYESTGLSGPYTLISSTPVTALPGENTQQWCSSGEIGIPLTSGRYYMVGVGSSGSLNYMVGGSYPVVVSFGTLTQSSQFTPADPLPVNLNLTGTGTTICAQRLTSCQVSRALRVGYPNGKELLEPGNQVGIKWGAVGSKWQGSDIIGLEYSSDGGMTWAAIPGAQNLPYNAGSFTWDTTGLPASDHYRVRALYAGSFTLSDVSDADFTIRTDTTGPVITHTPLADTSNRFGPYKVTASVRDDYGVASAKLYWNKNGGAFNVVGMPVGSSPTVSGSILGTMAVGDRISYYIEAQDKALAHNVTRSPASAPNELYCFTITPCSTEQVGNSSSYSPATSICAGNLFSIVHAAYLSRIEQYLSLDNQTNVRFFVYESLRSSGTDYRKVFESSPVLMGPGQQWYSSGAVSIPLVYGRYYLIGAAYEGLGGIYYSPQQAYTTAFGTCQVGSRFAYPPADIVSGNATDGPYYQKLTSCSVGRQLVISSPNGGQSYEPGAAVRIMWSAYGPDWKTGDTVALNYSSDGGSTWTPISDAANLAYNAASFDWDTSNLPGSTRYLVRVVYNPDSIVNDASDAVFAICPRSTPGLAKSLPDGAAVHLPTLAVSASFADRFYVQEDMRSSGIGILSTTAPAEGSMVSIYGTLFTSAGERMIQPFYINIEKAGQ